MTTPSAPSVVLHIGLHKTATRYLQREVFRALDPCRFNVNPDPLWPVLRQAVRNPDREDLQQAAAGAARDWRESGDDRTLLLSEPHISGDMYGQHHDHRANCALVHALFPEARILYFVRNQADWLQSAYRQQLVKGGAVPLHVFLNHYDGEFRPRPHRWVHGARTVEALNQQFLAIQRTYEEAFGADRVYLFRHEDLRSRPDAVHTALARALGLDALPASAGDRRHNRSYSALAIRLFHPSTRRRFPSPSATQLGPPDPRRQQWRRPLRRLRRLFIQHVFDRLIYVDWDLLAEDGLRAKIDRHYTSTNEELARHAARLPDEPGSTDPSASEPDGTQPRVRAS